MCKRAYTPYEMSTIIERMSAMNSITEARDYGTDEKFHAVEVHILSYIAEHPGISTTEIARDWNRTKGAVSQIIKKLERKNLIYKSKEEGNKKRVCLYVTEEGKKLDMAHQEYDSRNYINFLKIVKEYYTDEQIQEAFQFMDLWISLSMNWEPS